MKKIISLILLTGIFTISLGAQDISSLSESSYLEGSWDILKYHTYKMLDGDPKTSWVEGKDGPGIGEYVTINFVRSIKADTIKIMPGYFDPKWYAANNRVKRISLHFNDGSYTMVSDLSDGMTEKVIKLPKEISFKDIKIQIEAVYNGTEYDDTCIAEISFYRNGSIVNNGIDHWHLYNSSIFIEAGKLAQRASPAGLRIETPGMYGGDTICFFGDGTYCESSGDEGRVNGKWRITNNGKTVEIYNTTRHSLKGFGSSARVEDIMMGDRYYYSDYKYTKESITIHKNSYSWPGDFQRSILEGQYVGIITSVDYKMKDVEKEMQEKIQYLVNNYHKYKNNQPDTDGGK